MSLPNTCFAALSRTGSYCQHSWMSLHSRTTTSGLPTPRRPLCLTHLIDCCAAKSSDFSA